MKFKFPPWSDNEADVSSASSSYDIRLELSKLQFRYIFMAEILPYQLFWYQTLAFHFGTEAAPQFL